MIDLSGRTALVTGGSRGIGRAIALRLAGQGADVAFSYRGNESAAKATVGDIEALGRKGLAVQADVSDAEAADGPLGYRASGIRLSYLGDGQEANSMGAVAYSKPPVGMPCCAPATTARDRRSSS